MKNKKIISLISYSDSPNIGDNFQTLSTKNILEELGYNINYVDRDRKDTDERKIIFVNGYYSPKTIKNLNLKFSKNTHVIFYNIHLAVDNGRVDYVKNTFLEDENIYNTFKRFEPIGCRDESTKKIFQSCDIRSENNECITLLMKKRSQHQHDNAKKIILVDVDEFVPMPKNVNKEELEYRSQMISGGEFLSNDKKLNLSQEILDYYKNNAKLVITSRFHCAMPCIAMGIPVVFFGDIRSKRCNGLKKYIKYYDYVHIGKRSTTHLKKLSWSDKVPLLNKRIKYDFNIIDVIYNIFYKILLNIQYYLRIKKINWNLKVCNIEEDKLVKIKKIEAKLKELKI